MAFADPPRFFASEFPNDNPALHDGAIWVCFAGRGAARAVVRPRAALPFGAMPALAAPVVESAIAEVRTEAHVEESAAASLELELTPSAFADESDELEPELSLDIASFTSEPEAAPDAIAVLPEPEPAADVLAVSAEPEPAADSLAASAEAEPSPSDVAVVPPTDATPSVTPEPPPIDAIAEVASSNEAKPSDPADPFRAFVAALVDVALGAGSTRAAATIPALMEGDRASFDAFSEEVRELLVQSRLAAETESGVRVAESFTETAAAWRKVLRGETNDLTGCGTSTLDGWGVDVLRAFGVGRDGKLDVRRELRRRGVAAFGMLLAA